MLAILASLLQFPCQEPSRIRLASRGTHPTEGPRLRIGVQSRDDLRLPVDCHLPGDLRHCQYVPPMPPWICRAAPGLVAATWAAPPILATGWLPTLSCSRCCLCCRRLWSTLEGLSRSPTTPRQTGHVTLAGKTSLATAGRAAAARGVEGAPRPPLLPCTSPRAGGPPRRARRSASGCRA